ncbi:fumarylacetoacetate hydrolase family protein [Bacillus sp. NEB1478]|uniref:2-keto-4-pentenoate hydratase n=1 Tax=Bacillus sp. NEB1478 TaxID=3073816 RepID=UPI0028735688|nr:fumarylacetoacetate hydrolase family protein [Bacillus sp. NEB1478]WNB91234.1 fumarylacetoacetate hydrolase family protein [Bacillus sp. NEB1478]
MTVTNRSDIEYVDYLLRAEHEVKEVVKITDQYPELTIDEAYSIQKKLIEKRMEKTGSKRLGIKLGLTSKAKQQMMGVHEAIYGYLLSDMLAYEWEPLQQHRLIHPKAEPEIAFIMGEDLEGEHVTADDVMKAAKYVVAAIEVIDSRYKDFRFTLADVVADNCSSAKLILGSKMVKPEELDLAEIGMVMSKNGEIVTTGAGSAVLGHPAEAVAWAVQKLAMRNEGLKKGDVVLSGALSEAIAFDMDDTIVAQFDGLGSVTLSSRYVK